MNFKFYSIYIQFIQIKLWSISCTDKVYNEMLIKLICKGYDVNCMQWCCQLVALESISKTLRCIPLSFLLLNYQRCQFWLLKSSLILLDFEINLTTLQLSPF